MIPNDFEINLSKVNVTVAVFILGPHFCKKSPKLSDTVWDKSPTLNHVAIILKIKTNFSYSRTLRVLNNNKKRIPEREISRVVLFITFENQSNYKFKLRSPNTL